MIRILFLLLMLTIGVLTALVLLGRLLGRVARLLGKSEARQTWSWSWHVGSGGGRPGRPSQPLIQGETARDPVCGIFVSTEVSYRLTEQGATLHFCSRECRERYQRESAQT